VTTGSPNYKASAIIRELTKAGVEGEALARAIERIEAASKPVRSSNAERQARHRAKAKAEAKQCNDSNVTYNASERPLFPLSSPCTPNSPPISPSPDPDGSGQMKSNGPRAELFSKGLASLQRQTGKRQAQCRSLLGKMLAITGDEPARVLSAILQAEQDEIADPVAWLMRILGPPIGSNENQKTTKRDRMNHALSDWMQNDEPSETGNCHALQCLSER
jgi:hypothetical protein